MDEVQFNTDYPAGGCEFDGVFVDAIDLNNSVCLVVVPLVYILLFAYIIVGCKQHMMTVGCGRGQIIDCVDHFSYAHKVIHEHS